MLILPYIEQDKLYKEFHLDEPWDSEHNIRLVDRMPVTYALPPHKRHLAPPNHTVCHVFVGPGTAFERPGLKIGTDFTDGSSNTLLIVEAGEPVPWTKPEEIEFHPDQSVELRCLFRDGFRACLADGSVLFIKKDIDQAKLKAAITRNGGEQIRLYP